MGLKQIWSNEANRSKMKNEKYESKSWTFWNLFENLRYLFDESSSVFNKWIKFGRSWFFCRNEKISKSNIVPPTMRDVQLILRVLHQTKNIFKRTTNTFGFWLQIQCNTWRLLLWNPNLFHGFRFHNNIWRFLWINPLVFAIDLLLLFLSHLFAS